MSDEQDNLTISWKRKDHNLVEKKSLKQSYFLNDAAYAQIAALLFEYTTGSESFSVYK